MADEHKIKVGVRVKVTSQTGQIVGFGQVAYFGETEFKSGKWVGVVLDEPKGKNNGWVQGKQYFSCGENFGLFVNPDRITVIEEPVNPLPTAKQRPSIVPADSGIPHSSSSSGLATPQAKHSSSGIPSEKRTFSAIPAPTAVKRVQESTPMPSQETTPTSEEPALPSRSAAAAAAAASIPIAVASREPSASTTSASNPADSQRLAEATAQIRDLEEKLETLRIKRAEDRDKLKELERVKLQNQQLAEYKAKMQENFASLQTELYEAQKRHRELQEEFDRYREDTKDAHEVQEMLTMDKELAEEKLEMLQAEHSEMQEKFDAMNKENEALKKDLDRLTNRDGKSAASGDGESETVTSYQLRQLTEQNTKLKEACVRMRDIAQEDKREVERLRKLVDKQTTELGFLQKEKERAITDLDAAQRQIIDLHEQLDASLGADRLVVELGERNATLEDRVNQLADENSQLEALCDANDELLEVERDKQQELRNELDRIFVEKFEMKRKMDALAESLAECARAIQQYKAITSDLQTKLAQSQADLARAQPDSTNSANNGVPIQQPVALGMPQNIDFHTRFIEQQAFAKTIEIDLRKIELENANRHVQLLLAYLPDEFLRTGGEHDAMQVCLLVPRLASKANLLAEQVRASFLDAQQDSSSATSSDADAEFARVRRVSFAHVLICELQLLAGVLQQFDAALAACSVEQYVRVGTLHAQLTAHEATTVDYLLDLLRKDRLDETVSLDGLHKAVNYFVDLYRVQLCAVDANINGSAELDAFIRAAAPALDGIELDSRKLRALLTEAERAASADASDQSADALLAFVDQRAFELRDLLKRMRRYMTQLGADRDSQGSQLLALPKETAAHLQDAVGELALLVAALHLSVVDASRRTELDIERTGHIPEHAVRKLLVEAIEAVYGAHAASSSTLSVAMPNAGARARTALERATESLRSIVTALENGEFDADSAGLGNAGKSAASNRQRAPNSRVAKTPTFIVRAQAFKKGVEAVDELKRKLESAESESKDAKALVARKQQDCEEMKLRVELAEKKVENAQKSVGEKEFWKQMASEREDSLRKQKEEMDKTLDALQSDLDAAERENKDLKEKIKHLSKRSMLDNIAAGRPASPAGSANSAPTVQVQTKVQDSPMLLQQIETLQAIVQHLRQENASLAASQMKEKLASLKPLKTAMQQFVPGKFSLDAEGRMTDDEKREASDKPQPYAHYDSLNTSFKKLGELNYRLLTFCADAKVIDISQKESNPWRSVLKRKLTEKEIAKECDKVSNDAVRLLAQVQFGCTVRSDFREFPSTAFTNFVQKRLVDAAAHSKPAATDELVEVNNDQLATLHSRLLKLAEVA